VGKTTTIAKIAAGLALQRGNKVGLLTLDTFRVAAVDQLRVFADILGLPLRVVERPEQVTAALSSLRHCDWILVDSAGRSPLNDAHLGALRDFAQALEPDECHLVLSVSTRTPDLLLAAHRFGAARCDRLLFTKLDETEHYGAVLEVTSASGLPLSYLTFGQRVPEDICGATSGMVAALVLEGVAAASWRCT